MERKTPDKAKVTADRGRLPIAEGVTSHMLGDQLLVFSERTQTLYSLNSSAAFMWLCLESGRSMDETSELVSETFNIGFEQALSDVEAIVAQWKGAGLLRSAEPIDVLLDVAGALESIFPEPEPYQGTLPGRFHSELCFRLAGSTFLVRCAREEYERQLRPVLAHLETAAGLHDEVLYVVNDGDDHVIVFDGLIAGCFPLPEQIPPALSQTVLRAAYRRVNYLISVHGAVVHNGSQCVILAGPSGIGKSTLTAALIKDGLGYFTDEVAVLHRETRRVVPVPAGLRIKESAWAVMSQLYHDFDQSPIYRLADGGRLRYFRPPERALPSGYESGLPVCALIFPRYAPEEETVLRSLDRVDALHRLQDAGYEAGHNLDGERVQELLDWISGVDCHEMTVSSLDDAVTIIRGVFG